MYKSVGVVCMLVSMPLFGMGTGLAQSLSGVLSFIAQQEDISEDVPLEQEGERLIAWLYASDTNQIRNNREATGPVARSIVPYDPKKSKDDHSQDRRKKNLTEK